MPDTLKGFYKNSIKDKRRISLKRAVYTTFFICLIGLIFVLWVTYLYPLVESSLKVWELFLIFYVLIIVLWFGFYIGLLGYNKTSLKLGIVTSIISAIIDLFCPAFAVGIDGNVISGDMAGYRGSIDYTFGYYLNCFGLHGIIVFIMVYFLIPFMVFMIILVILKPKEFIKVLKKSG